MGGEEGRCRCYERRRGKSWGIWILSQTRWNGTMIHCCHTHLNTSVSRTWSDYVSLGCDNRCTSVHAWARRGGRVEEENWGISIEKVVYYEPRKRELKTRPIYACRCDERLKTKAEESTHLVYTGLIGKLEHLKIKTRLIDEKFASVKGESVI